MLCVRGTLACVLMASYALMTCALVASYHYLLLLGQACCCSLLPSRACAPARPHAARVRDLPRVYVCVCVCVCVCVARSLTRRWSRRRSKRPTAASPSPLSPSARARSTAAPCLSRISAASGPAPGRPADAPPQKLGPCLGRRHKRAPSSSNHPPHPPPFVYTVRLGSACLMATLVSARPRPTYRYRSSRVCPHCPQAVVAVLSLKL